MADGIVINKADGDNIEKAKLAESQFRNALHLFPPSPSGWTPEVTTCSSLKKTGIAEVWEMINTAIQFIQQNHYFYERRSQQAKYWMYETIDETLKNSFYHQANVKNALKKIENEVLNEKMSSFVAAKTLLSIYFKNN